MRNCCCALSQVLTAAPDFYDVFENLLALNTGGSRAITHGLETKLLKTVLAAYSN
jgi:hypothetical protein